jgi:hypothetical protein
MQPNRSLPSTSAPSNNLEQGESSNNTLSQPFLALQTLANQIQQESGHHFSSALGAAQQIIEHVAAKNKRIDDLKANLSVWAVNQLPKHEFECACAMIETLLHKKPDQKTLSLEFKQSIVPDFVGFFPQLEALNITTSAAQLPESIGQATKLKALSIQAQNLTALPSSLGNLSKLNSLALDGCNQITELPESMSTLGKFKTLICTRTTSSNPLPRNIHIFKNLQNIHVGSCTTAGDTLTRLQGRTNLQQLLIEKTPLNPQDLHLINSLVSLKKLSLKQCGSTLTDISHIVCNLKNLTELNLEAWLALRFIPETISRKLKSIDIKDCSMLQRLPESIGELNQLTSLYAYGCRALSSLPSSIVELSSACRIDLTRTGLSARILEDLSRQTELSRQRSNGIRGPQVNFSLPPAVTAPVGTLKEEALKWFQEANEPTPLTQHIEQLDHPSASAMATLLARFRHTAQYIQNPHGTAKRIHRLLNELLKQPEVLTSFCAMALESSETCDDRTALGLLHMELALLENRLIHRIKTTSETTMIYRGVHRVAQSIFKQKQLMEIAHQHATTAKGFVDETEIVLKYLVNLGKDLNLPARLDHMLYSHMAWQVTPEHLQHAKQVVSNCANLDNPDFLNFLATWHPWQEAVKRLDPVAHQHIQAKQTQLDEHYAAKQEALLEEYTMLCENEPDGQYAQKALNKLAEINMTRDQRKQKRTATWYPHIHQSLSLTQGETSTAQPNKRARPNESR